MKNYAALGVPPAKPDLLAVVLRLKRGPRESLIGAAIWAGHESA
jgi:hypothetical protein